MLLRVAALDQGDGRHRVAKEWPRGGGVSQLLGRQRQVEELELGTAVRRRNGQTRDAEVHEPGP